MLDRHQYEVVVDYWAAGLAAGWHGQELLDVAPFPALDRDGEKAVVLA
jgi:hypothetical protein